MALITYGDVKADLAEYAENGVTSADTRVIPRTNAAMRALARAMPRGVFVGSTSILLNVPVNSQGVFALPAGYDVALAVESDTETTQLPSGWYDLLSRSTFISPDDLIGTAFYDLGQDPTTGIRSYCAPHLPASVTSLTVSALKAFVPIVDDTTPLYVQNVEAIKYWLLSLFQAQRSDNLDMAEKYQARAVQELTGELQRHIDDPSLYAARMAQWQFDAVNLPAGTLGNITARMALDFAAGQKIGRVDLYRVTNEASRQATQIYNDLGKTERLSNNAGPESITYVTAANRGDVLSYPDYEVLALLVRAQGPGTTPEQIPVLKDQAAKLVARNLATKIIAARNLTWQTLMTTTPTPQFGGMRAELGLELAGDSSEDGYRMSDRYVSRMTRQAWSAAVDQFNLLSRTEDYEQVALPLPPAVPTDNAVVPFPIEVIKLLFESLVCQDKNEADRANAYKQEALRLIQRNLVALVERQRRTLAETQMLLDPSSFGYHKGRLALEMDGGLGMSDAKRGRLINEAEELLNDSGRWKFSEAQYYLAVDQYGNVTLPADVDNILYAEQCGQPIELKDRSWFYKGCLTRQGNGWYGLGGWGWDISGSGITMIYGGTDDCGNTHYTIPGCNWNTGTNRPAVRALCSRKWLMKQNESDEMLVQSYPAIKSMVASIIARRAGDTAGAEYNKNVARSALDQQLSNTMEGQVTTPTVVMPGLPLGGGRNNRPGIRARSSWY